MAENSQKPLIIAHRGGAGLFVENTLGAFKKALDRGFSALEFDIHVTQDGVPVVYHDPRLHPALTRDKEGRWVEEPTPFIKDLTWAELAVYKGGKLNRAHPYSQKYPQCQDGEDEPIPRLSDVLAVARTYLASSGQPTRHHPRSSQNLTLFIELKHSPENPEASLPPEMIVDTVLDTLRGAQMEHHAVLLAFNWALLERVRQVAPNLRRGYATVESAQDTVRPGPSGFSPWLAGYDVTRYGRSLPRAVQAAGGTYWAPLYHNLTPHRREECRDLGIALNPWTVDDPETMKKFLALGVEALTTNRPDLVPFD